MKALVIHGAEDLHLEDREIPTPGEHEVRLRVRYVGICGSDLHYYFHGANGEFMVREPLVPGHEFAAEVDLDPSGDLAPGTAVTVHPARFGRPVTGLEDKAHLWPGGDYLGSAAPFPHRQGAAAEYLVVEREMIRTLPSGLSLRRAALAEPLAVAMHAVSLADGVAGRRALVIGAGPIGLLVVAALRAAGAGEIHTSDVKTEPLERAAALGNTTGYVAGRDEVPVDSFDVVFECSGAAPALTQAVRSVARAGQIVQVGMLPNTAIEVNLAPLLGKEAAIRGAFRFLDEIDDAIALLATDASIDVVVSHELSVDDAVAAFDIARDSSRSAKVLITF